MEKKRAENMNRKSECDKEIVDQDEFQLKDETNKKWVEAWKKAVGLK